MTCSCQTYAHAPGCRHSQPGGVLVLPRIDAVGEARRRTAAAKQVLDALPVDAPRGDAVEALDSWQDAFADYLRALTGGCDIPAEAAYVLAVDVLS